ncbi:uncharacterized protein METZ01_LOCUS209344 [marine metagenome]|uniref:Uncharacterized protein n=1 Tax=marine metagenome TaxID=408172 RepID=A0A382F0L5_9ZZZZ
MFIIEDAFGLLAVRLHQRDVSCNSKMAEC